MKRIIVFTLFYVCALSFLFAQNAEEEVVYLHDGSIIRGQIIKRVTGAYIKIELLGGSVFVLQEADIEKIEREATKDFALRLNLKKIKNRGTIAERPRGFYNAFDFQLPWGQSIWGRVPLPPHLVYRFGFRFDRKLNVGMGIGINYYIEGGTIPVFAELHGVWGETFKKVMPYYYAQAGYAESSWSDRWAAENFKGGVMAVIGGGFKIHTRSRLAWIFSLGLKYQTRSYDEVLDNFPNTSRRHVNDNSISTVLSFGFEI